MTSPYGDGYPLGDRLPDPATYPTFDQLELDALVGVDELLAESGLNYDLALLQMRTLAGFFNGGAGPLDEPTYNRLPITAKQATIEITDACRDYLCIVELQDEVAQEFEALDYQEFISDREDARIVLNYMDTHIFQASQNESRRRYAVLYRGAKAAGMSDSVTLPPEDPAAAEQERMNSSPAYSELALREVLKVAGRSLRPLIDGYSAVAPLNLDRRKIIAYAYQNIEAARNRQRR